jgi:hypothetical protein
LLSGDILGIVDYQGAVESVFTGDKVAFHRHYWPVAKHCQWRWCHRHGLQSFNEKKPDAEQVEAIRNHLTKKYGLRWWENGHHDIDDLVKRGIPERKRKKKK